MKIVVIAGGQGTKLWPYSREDKPKQFQPIVGDKSLFAETVEILLQKFAAEDIFISTKRKFIKYVSEQAPRIPLKNYIIDPNAPKDRGPAEGFVFVWLSVHYPNEPFFMVQADCVRQPASAFIQMVADAGEIVERDKKFITGGLKATEPDMGVDYLQLGDRVSGSRQEVYAVKAFIDRKGSYKETKELIENFHVVTHCNHSCWYPELMLEAYKKYRPDWHKALMKMRDAIGKPGEDAAIEAIHSTMAKGATEEVTKHVMAAGEAHIILLPFRWTDIGTWGSVYEFFIDGNAGENYKDGHVVSLNTTGSIIKTNRQDKLIAVAGVEDMVIVDTDDVLLVIPKDKIEQIKQLQADLQASGEQKYL